MSYFFLLISHCKQITYIIVEEDVAVLFSLMAHRWTGVSLHASLLTLFHFSVDAGASLDSAPTVYPNGWFKSWN